MIKLRASDRLVRPTGRARRALIVGALMAVLALPGALGFSSRATAQDERAQAQPLEVRKQAYYTHSLGNVAPPILTDQFPPQVVCLLVPELCTEEVLGVTGPIDDVLGENQPEDTIPSLEPTGIVQPGDLPVSILGGALRHQSAIAFDLPPVPAGHEIEEFALILFETEPTFHVDSPAFRQLVVGLLALSQGDPSELQKVPDAQLIQSETFQGIEACALIAPFEAGESLPGSSAPTEEEIDCIFGANGHRVVDEAGGTYWVFNLRGTANAWLEEETPNEGLLLRPIAPANVAYGDPDLTTSEQVTFEGQDAEAATSPAFVLMTTERSEPVTLGGGGGGGATPDRTPSGRTELFAAPEQMPTDRAEALPTQTEGAPVAGSGAIVTPWFVWLLLPILLAGSYLSSEALMADPRTTVRRSGAMTRLLERGGR